MMYFPDLGAISLTISLKYFGKLFICIVEAIFYYKQLNLKTMGNLLYLIAVILIIGWLLGFFVWHAGGLIHILLVIAVIAIILKLINRA